MKEKHETGGKTTRFPIFVSLHLYLALEEVEVLSYILDKRLQVQLC